MKALVSRASTAIRWIHRVCDVCCKCNVQANRLLNKLHFLKTGSRKLLTYKVCLNHKTTIQQPASIFLSALALHAASVLAPCCLTCIHAAELAPEFISFASQSPMISYFAIAIPGENFAMNHKQLNGWAYFEGALQGDTFWIRNLTNSVVGSGPPFRGAILGASKTERWIVDGDQISKAPKTNTHVNAVQQYHDAALATLRRSFGFGQPIEQGSFVLDKDNTFRATTSLGPILTGKFEVTESGRPMRCQLSSSFEKGLAIEIAYSYDGRDERSMIPSSFIVSGKYKLMQGPKMEYKILQCDFGTNNIGANGYTPDQFRSATTFNPLLAQTFMFSNSTVYAVSTNGSLQVVMTANRVEISKRNKLLFVIAGLATTTIVFLLAYRGQGKIKVT